MKSIVRFIIGHLHPAWPLVVSNANIAHDIAGNHDKIKKRRYNYFEWSHKTSEQGVVVEITNCWEKMKIYYLRSLGCLP